MLPVCSVYHIHSWLRCACLLHAPNYLIANDCYHSGVFVVAEWEVSASICFFDFFHIQYTNLVSWEMCCCCRYIYIPHLPLCNFLFIFFRNFRLDYFCVLFLTLTLLVVCDFCNLSKNFFAILVYSHLFLIYFPPK